MADIDDNPRNEELIRLLIDKVEHLRPKLLDLSRRNPLISTRMGPKSRSIIRVVDELPDVLSFNLMNGTEMRFVPLPPVGEDPKDEQSREFQSALNEARLTDEIYLNAQTNIDPDDENLEENSKTIDRALKDRVREALGMAPHASTQDISAAQHARNNGISPSYDLPLPSEEHEDGRHSDTDIQTLQYGDAMERTLNGISTKCKSWVQETGINVMHAALGFLEWREPNGRDKCFAPLVLTPVEMDKRRSREGLEFWVKGLGEEPETNMVMAEKLKLDFDFEIPEFGGGSIEEYFAEVNESSPVGLEITVRRQAVFGVFPSARMAMYDDLDTRHSAFERSEVLKDLIIGSNNSEASPFGDEYEVDKPEIENKIPHLVLDADSSQFSSLVDIADGKNLALEGPPGTGKSQTIVNAIAAALADGKKVLFVAEKMAALEVVRNRLEAVGLGEFVLPLQAERSTREQVIKSIRNRVEMDVQKRTDEYEARLNEFRNLRSNLAEYTQALSQTYGNAGLTVHDILGKYISTQDILHGLPRDIEKLEIGEVEHFSNEQFREIREASDRLQQCRETASRVKPHWRGFGLSALDRFLVEDIKDLSETASNSLAELAQQFESLNKFSSEFENTSAGVDELKEALEGLQEVDLEEHGALIERIKTKDNAELIDQFCELVQHFRDQQNLASEAVSSPDDEVWDGRLSRIISFCEDFGLTSADPKAFDEFLWATEEKQVSLKNLADQLKVFMSVVPVCTRFSMGELKSIRDFVETVPREVLAMRSEILSLPDTALLLKKAKTQAQNLSAQADLLAKRISVSKPKSGSELRALATTIDASGSLGPLYSNYRRAKKEYMNLSRSRDFDKANASADLRALADWHDQVEEYIGNPNWKSIFGSHYQELKTDFGLFEQVLKFYEEVGSRFPGVENLTARNFLKNEPLDTLLSIPDFDAQSWKGDYDALQDELIRLNERQIALNSDVEKVRALAGEIHQDFVDEIQKLRDLQNTCEVTRMAKNAINESGEVQSLIGQAYKGIDSNIGMLRASAHGAKKISALPLNWQKIILGLAQSNRLNEFRECVYGLSEQIREAMETVQSLAKKCEVSQDFFVADRDPLQIAEFLREASADEEGMYAHAALRGALTEFQELGLPNLLELFDRYEIEPARISRVTDALIARSLSRKVYEQYGKSLSKFNGERIDSLRSKLASVDRELIQLSRQRLRMHIKAWAEPPRGNRVGKKSTWTEFSLIENEINKKKRFISIRDLTTRAGTALQELKPCWMMSPLAVAQYIKKGGVSFDLCIIDEASQMPPEDALGALVRCDRALVVGDTNQLPPTSFFRRMFDDEEIDEDEKVLDESILEMANLAFRPKRRLRWHYRSRHPDLIKFSNRLIYDDDLIVFPSAHENNQNMGVSYVKVEGTYKSGVNSHEASKLVDSILDFMKKNPKRSLGVVTLNKKQQELIEEELEFALQKAPWATRYIDDWTERNDGLENFFVKNLENVQGDERDVIFIGTVYGPSELGGPVMQRFGPINGVAGKRRLNVLFSRAKEQIVTFSSMTAEDIRADEHGNPGTFMLKRWLEYSKTGVLESGQTTGREPDSVFEEHVIEQIRTMGCEAVPQVGVAGYFIDIGVKHPNWPHGFLLGVECDGASYHSAKSARDRDRLRQEVLEGLGWHFHRIWSTDWFNDPSKQATFLREKINNRLEELKASTAARQMIVQEKVEEFIDPPEPPNNRDLDFAEPNEIQSDKGVCEGDVVTVQYLSGEKSKVRVTITSDRNDAENGKININQPLAKALLGEEEGEEIEFLVGSYVRRVLIEKIQKPD